MRVNLEEDPNVDQTRTALHRCDDDSHHAAAKSVPVLAQTSADRPGFFATKDIAEAGFIYGLPIVMNYKTMY